MTSDTNLDILLIEDSPGDVRLIEEMLSDSEELLQRFASDEQLANGTVIHHEDTLRSGLDRLSAADCDVILLDLGLPDSTGLDTLSAVVDDTEFVPIVVLTGLSDEAIGIKAIQHGAQDYLVKDEVTSDLLVRSIHYALERNRQERERARRREQLEALNRLNEIGQDVTHAVITTSTREELEQAVCDRFVDSDAYRFAWIGGVDRANDRVKPRVVAGAEEGYLDEVTITVEEDETAQGPAGKAVRTGAVQAMQNVQTDPEYEPWREQAIERGYRSSAAVPIQYEEVLYGVLNVYASSVDAFSEPEREILSRLGDVIGHAITAMERKEALMSDRVLELEFEAEGFASDLVALTSDREGRISIDNLVHTDEATLAYGRVYDIPQTEFREGLTQPSIVDDLRILSAEDDVCEFESIITAITPLVNAVATHGGRITSATVADGEFRFVVEFPPGRDRRQLIGLVQEHCPGATNQAQRLVDRGTDDVHNTHSLLYDTMTEKQRRTIQIAYSAGLFEWPRQSTSQELAERMDVAPATFSQHLRAAQQKCFDEIFNSVNDGDPGPDE